MSVEFSPPSSSCSGFQTRLDLTCRVLKDFDSVDGLQGPWDHLVENLNAPVYMTYDWVRLWWEFYGAGSRLRVFLYYNGDRLVGVVPIYVSVLSVFPVQIGVARLVGANIPPKIFGPAVEPDFATRIWRETLEHLFVREGCDLVSLGPLCASYAGLGAIQTITGSENSFCSPAQIIQRDVHTVYHLPKTFDNFLEALDGKERKIRRKKLRDLDGIGPIRIEVIKAPDLVEQEFERFAALHTAQWQADGRPGHFHAWPNALEFNRALVKAQGRLGRVRFVRLFAGETLVANQYNFACGDTLYAELPCRAFGGQWEKLSLGCSSQIKLLQAAIEEGFNQMESGLGHYDYKLLLNGQERPAVVLRMTSKTLSSRIRVRACSGASELLTLFSNKLWYRRISPHLPKALRHGQSATTLRYDF